MVGMLGIMNGVWMATVFHERLEVWGWLLTSATALAPTIMIGFGCLGAYMYDEQTRY